MESNAVKRLALVLAVQAEIEEMKAENTYRQHLLMPILYTGSDFAERAEELRNLAYSHDEQLF